MHVGVLSTSYPRDPHDWAGHFVRGQARWFRFAGHDVTVVCAGPRRRRTWIEEDGVRVLRLPGRGLFYTGGAPEALSRRLSWACVPPFIAAMGVGAVTGLRRADALVTHWLVPCGVLGCLLARGRPHLAVAHSGDVHLLERFGDTARRAAVSLLTRSGTRVAFASAPLRERLLAHVPPGHRAALLARSAVVPMGIDAEALRPRRPRVPRSGQIRVAFVGRPSPIKGLSVLQRAVSGLPGVQLRVADGKIPGDDKRRFFEEADVLAVPSLELADGRTEGTPTVVLEGMASGLPVVASRTGGIPDVLRDGVSGLLVPPGDADRLARALALLRDDVALRIRLGRVAAAEADRHDWSRVGPALASLL